MKPDDELRHVLRGVKPGETLVDHFQWTIEAASTHDSERVLERLREVMSAVVAGGFNEWPSVAEWQTRLPAWFVAKAAPTHTREEVETFLARWRTLTSDERRDPKNNLPWDLDNWLYAIEPDQRLWHWWDAEVVSPDVLVLTLALDDAHAPMDALRWLLEASGATEIDGR